MEGRGQRVIGKESGLSQRAGDVIITLIFEFHILLEWQECLRVDFNSCLQSHLTNV